jgi:hypothetical protein
MIVREPVIWRVLGGSHAYGLNTPTSDVDTIEVYVEDPTKTLGPIAHTNSVKATHRSDGENDLTRYPLRKFLHLAMQGNPTVLESLYSQRLPADNDSRIWDFQTELVYLIDQSAFFSLQMVPRYRGYMRAQTLRLLGLRGGHSAGRESRKTEASERAGYDTKYAMHVVRLGMFCHDLLTYGRLTLPVTEDRREYLLSIRNGEIAFHEVFAHILLLDKTIEDIASNSKLRRDPDRERIVSLSVRTHLRFYGDG